MRITTAVGIATALAVTCLTTATTATAATAVTSGGSPAIQHAHQQHGLGLDLAAVKAHKHALQLMAAPDLSKIAPVARAGAAPASADLTRYALRPGDQGQVGSCVAWATGYSGYGVLMNEQHIGGGAMAPMFIYSQIARGSDDGTYASVALPMEKSQGIDTKTDYWQGDFDYTTQPDSHERTSAGHYKLSGFAALPTGGAAAKSAIKDAISRGMPVPIGFTVHQSFMDLDEQSASDYSYLPGDSNDDPVVGGHEVTIVAYNAQGVKIENSWGSDWGTGGFFTVPWSFFDTGDVDEVHAMGKIVQS
ncbi:C1 family peptidase [Kitasatospora cinereorecta]|uniref:C1 family peptidase n=1 Tax=Kitasatospora cinereorecta TaxID=285560 RepID=A0ABW0V5N1_9ACTN